MGNVVLLSLIFYLISAMIQMFVHELGHYIFGVLTGYRFLYFQVGPLFLYKDKRLHLIFEWNFGGQCVMIPKTNAPFSFVLYNLGGIIANILLSIICILAAIFLSGYSRKFFLVLLVAGVIKIISNGIPRKRGKYSTDAYNVQLLCKYRRTREDYVVYLQLYEKIFLKNKVDKKNYYREVGLEETEESLFFYNL